MKQYILNLLVIVIVSFVSCKKKEVKPVITDDQIIIPNAEDTRLPDFKLVSLSVATTQPSQVEWMNNQLIGLRQEAFKNTIIKSIDKGVSWTTLIGAGAGSAFLAKANNQLFITTDKVLQSSSNGTSWGLVSTNFDFNAYTINNFKANDKFMVITSNNLGRSQYYTHVSTDQGATFKLVNTSNTFNKHLGLTDHKIWIVRNDSLLSSQDSGSSFQKVNLATSGFYRFKAFDKVVVISGTKEYNSYDEGATWVNNSERIFPFGKLYNGQLLAHSERGDGSNPLYRSPDNGRTWLAFGLGSHIESKAISSSTETWLTNGQLVYYKDGYPNWRLVGIPPGQVTDAEFTKNGTYLAIGKLILYSHDGGKMWDLRQHLGSWPGASCLSIHPDGRVLVTFGGQTGSPLLNIYDYQLLNLLESKTYGIAGATCSEMMWFENEGKFLGLFTKFNQDTKYPVTSSSLLSKWTLTSQFGLQAGKFLDGTHSDLSLYALIDKTVGKQPQIANTILPNASAFFWNTTSFRCKVTGQAKSIAHSNSKGKILVQYAANFLYIANNEAVSKQWTEFDLNETAEKIRFDLSNHLWVFTNKGTYKSDKPLVFE